MYIIKSINGNIIKAKDKPQIHKGDKVWYVNLPFEEYKEEPIYTENIDENIDIINISKQKYKMEKKDTVNIEVDKENITLIEELNISVDKSTNIIITQKHTGQQAVITVDKSKKIKYNESGIYYIEALNKISNKITIIVSDNSMIQEI